MGLTKTEQYSKMQNELAVILKALGHPARIAIVEYLLKVDQCICNDLVEELPLSQSTISQLAPDGSTIHIKGNLNAVIKNTAITDGSSSQSVTYSLYMKDRAGNMSNTITTSAITITQ